MPGGPHAFGNGTHRVFTDYSLPQYLSPRIATYVGPYQTEHGAHKDVLTKIPYFKAAFDGGFEGGIENSIAMPEDDLEAFEQILDYVYTGKPMEAMPHNPDSQSNEIWKGNKLLLKTYILAEKLCMEQLTNALMDTFRLTRRTGSLLSTS